jgi:DNA-binding beta-propeller fold protein YncE
MPELITTDGKRHYRVQRHWPILPDGMTVGQVSQLAVHPSGRLYAVQRDCPAVLVFSPDGTLEQCWEHPQLLSTDAGGVHGIGIAPDGMVLITTFDSHQVLGFSPNGELLLELGQFNEPTWGAPFNHPTGVAVAPNGDLFVTDGYGNARVHRFSAAGELILSWGEPGVGPGQFSCPHGVWIDSRGRVVVLDRDNHRIQVFDTQGTLLDIWLGFVKPMGIWSDGSGELFVSDQTPRICRVSEDGQILGAMRGFTVYPHGIAGDRDGNLFVAEQLPFGIAKYAVRR